MDQTKSFLTFDEAYDAMFAYLDEYYNRTKSDDIGSLLSGMQLLKDGCSADPAAMHDWKESVKKILNQNPRVRPYLVLTNEGDKVNS